MHNITLYSVTLKGLVGFENNFNGTTFHHHFCLKTGVKCPENFLYYSLAPETYNKNINISTNKYLVHKIEHPILNL